jgi:PadR family transcriptional regulator PadR
MARRQASPIVPTLSHKEALILQLLGRSREMYGLELVSASDGALKRGTVYVTLGRMEEKGYVASRLDDSSPPGGGLPRRLYAPTALGRQVLSAWAMAARRLAPRFAR